MAMYLCNGGKSGGRACVADFDFTTGTSDSSGNNFKITVGGGASRDSEGYHLNNYNSNIKVTEFPGWSGLNFDIELDFGDYNIASPYANNVFVGFSGVNGLVYKNGYGFGIMTSSSTNPSSYASDTNINTFKNSTMRFVANGRNYKIYKNGELFLDYNATADRPASGFALGNSTSNNGSPRGLIIKAFRIYLNSK